jgi:hypothetical protein
LESRLKKAIPTHLRHSNVRLFGGYEEDMKNTSDYVRKDNKIHRFEAEFELEL